MSSHLDGALPNTMTKPAAAAAAGPAPPSGPYNMQREAKITWSLSILPKELEKDYLQHDLRFWQSADAIGLWFWVICNLAQFCHFNRAKLTALNWLLNWHTLPLSLLAILQLVAAARAPQWYRRHRLKIMLALRLTRTTTQLVAYWRLAPKDILRLSSGKDSPAADGVLAVSLLALVPLTQMQQALSCLLPFHVMLPVQLTAAAFYFRIYLPNQLCTIRLVPLMPELATSWCGSLSTAMDRCMLLLAMLPGASCIPSGCGSSSDEVLLLILLFFMLLLVLFIPVAFVFTRELTHKRQFLKERQCRVVCAWDRWGWVQGPLPPLLVAAVVLLIPWRLALAGAAVAVRVLPNLCA